MNLSSQFWGRHVLLRMRDETMKVQEPAISVKFGRDPEIGDISG
jgi:hypothetical protein